MKKSIDIDNISISFDEEETRANSSGSESNTEEIADKVRLKKASDLVSHKYDYDKNKFKNSNHIRRRKRIVEIKKIPQFEQKSPEWLNQRKKCLTATAIAIAIDEDPYKTPAHLLLDKCDRCPRFKSNVNTHHGNKYEEIANMYYTFRNNIDVAEYGMIRHSERKFIGASPDGICEKRTSDGENLSTLVGRLLEIKCPKTRKIKFVGDLNGDICPHYYYVQVQTQLFVTEMDECDFLQCAIHDYASVDDYIADSDPTIPTLSKKTGLEKGCIIQLLPRKITSEPEIYDSDEERIDSTDPEVSDEYTKHLFEAKYIYPERLHMSIKETNKWIADQTINYHENKYYKTHMIDKVIYYRFNQISCNLIKKDPVWFESKIPILKQFWFYVRFYRKHPNRLNNLVKYVKEVGIGNTKVIFEHVHKDYMRFNKNSKYEPLYREKNPWRIKYDNLDAYYESRRKKQAGKKN